MIYNVLSFLAGAIVGLTIAYLLEPYIVRKLRRRRNVVSLPPGVTEAYVVTIGGGGGGGRAGPGAEVTPFKLDDTPRPLKP